MRKIFDNILLNFQQKKNIQKLIFIYFLLLKNTISPRKVRHVSARRNVRLCLTANYLHINILTKT